jgi:hypothetical protein
MSERANPPTQDQVAAKLRELIAGDISPEGASEWASPWITKLEEVIDAKVKRALVELGGADLIVDMEGHRLHGRTDYAAWLKELTGESC